MAETGHILVTGGAGYIGSVLTGALLRRGDWVTVVDDLLFGGESLLSCTLHPAFHFLRADVGDAGVLQKAADETSARGAPPITAVVHLAAIVGFPACQVVDREVVWRTNVDSLRRVYEDAAGLGVKRLLFSSTYSVYGVAENDIPVTEDSSLRPQSLYAETKIAAEEYLRKADRDSLCAPVIFRFATLFGCSPRMRFDLIINQFVLEAFTQGELLIYKRGYSRSFVHIQDVIAGLILGLDAPDQAVRGQVFNLGDEKGNYTKDEVVDLIKSRLPETRIQYKDLSFKGDMRDICVSFDKIETELGFVTRWTIPEGIEDVLSILRSGLIADPYADRFRNAKFIVK